MSYSIDTLHNKNPGKNSIMLSNPEQSERRSTYDPSIFTEERLRSFNCTGGTGSKQG